MVEVAWSRSVRKDAFPISTDIVVIGGVKGLMEIADQMKDEFESTSRFRGSLVTIRADG